MKNPLSVFVFNVGQGDHILIEFPNGEYGIIDCYYDKSINYPLEPPGLTYLKKIKERGGDKAKNLSIAFLHITHYHFDHLNGLEKWLCWIQCENIPFRNLLLPRLPSADLTRSNFMQILADESVISAVLKKDRRYFKKLESLYLKLSGSSILQLEAFKKLYKCLNFKIDYLDGQRPISLFEKSVFQGRVRLFCLAPSTHLTTDLAKMNNAEILESIVMERNPNVANPNDLSTILVLQAGDFTLTFGGDAERRNINQCIVDFTSAVQDDLTIDLKSDFIKLFHHGSHRSSSLSIWRKFMKKGKDIYFAASANRVGNGYNHPSDRTFEQIRRVAEEKRSTPRVYATNHQQLQGEGHGILADTNLKEKLGWKSNPDSDFMEYTNQKNDVLESLMSLDNVHTIDANSQRRNDRNMIKKRFMGYKFEFNIDDETIQVKKLTA